jgi:hypothetical protein
MSVSESLIDEPKVSWLNLKCFSPFLTQDTTYSNDEVNFYVAKSDDDDEFKPSMATSRFAGRHTTMNITNSAACLSAFNKPKSALHKRQKIQKPTTKKQGNREGA